MEITLLTETELKVTLTADDMERYAIDCARLDYGTTETRRAFWSILDEARRRTGFDAARDRVYVRVYPADGGGCDMYVTKLTDAEERCLRTSADHASTATEKIPPALPAGKGANHTPAADPIPVIYALEEREVSGLIRLCALLCSRGYDRDSALYAVQGKNGGHRFFLTVKENAKRGITAPAVPPLAILDEYGTRVASSAMLLCLKEHADCLCAHHAIEQLAALQLPGT